MVTQYVMLIIGPDNSITLSRWRHTYLDCHTHCCACNEFVMLLPMLFIVIL